MNYHTVQKGVFIMKKIISFLLIACMAFFMTACGQGNELKNGENVRTYTDMSGREIRIQGEIKAYAISWVGCADIFAMLDNCKSMVAYPKTSTSYSRFVKEYVDESNMIMLPKEDISAEEVINSGAEVVFARIKDIEGIVDQLEKAGIVVVDVEFKDYEQMLKSVQLCADILGTEEAQKKADSFVKYGIETLSTIETLVQENKDSVSASALAIRDTKDYRAYGPGRYAGKWIEMCGFSCPLETDDPEAFVNLTAEEIARYDTDYIFFALPGEAQNMQSDSKWNGLKAYDSGRIYNCPECFNTWCNQGSESLLQLYWACDILYPEKVSYKMEDVVYNFYKDFYSLELSADEIASMLNI